MTPRTAYATATGVLLAALLSGCTETASFGQETPAAPTATTAPPTTAPPTTAPATTALPTTASPTVQTTAVASSAVTTVTKAATATATTTVTATATGTATATSGTTGTKTLPDGMTVTAGQLQSFTSPTGNISCWLDLRPRPDPDEYPWEGVGCRVVEADWTVPTPAYCLTEWEPNWISLDVTGGLSEGTCGRVPFPATSPVLPYGEAVRGGGFTCYSEEVGVTCIVGDSFGFFVSRAAYRIVNM